MTKANDGGWNGGWKIYLDDTLLSTANYVTQDQPWYICDFEPTT
jgi:hypothetical protein